MSIAASVVGQLADAHEQRFPLNQNNSIAVAGHGLVVRQ